MFSVKKVHFVGIGGTGMNGIAEVMLNLGYEITGSDLRRNAAVERLQGLGARIFIGHAKENIGDADVVVISSAVKNDNPEVVAAREKRIPVVPRAIMLAEMMRLRDGIAVAGTHGKTTTTSLVTSILKEGGFDPTFVIGGRLNAAGANAKLGKGKFLVAEADESDASFLYLSPVVAVITNIDQDHMDTYGHDIRKLKQAFIDFAMRLPFYGKAVLCLEDENVRSIVPMITKPIMTYGFGHDAQVRATNIRACGTQMHFTVETSDYKIEPFEVRLNLPGRHNVLNALAAIGVALTIEVPIPAIQAALASFTGVGRRFSIWGQGVSSKGNKFIVVDDYGHHPSEMAATIAAARSAYPDKSLLLAFQPHRYTRTRDCFEGLVKVLSTVDNLVLCEVYPAGETPLAGADSVSLCRAIKARGGLEPVYAANVDEVQRKIDEHVRDNGVVLVMGAGNIDAIPARLVSKDKN